MRVKKLLKTALVFALRLVLHLPLQLVASVMYAISEATDALDDGFSQMARGTRQITEAPFVADWRAEIARLDEENRLRLLRQLSRGIE